MLAEYSRTQMRVDEFPAGPPREGDRLRVVQSLDGPVIILDRRVVNPWVEVVTFLDATVWEWDGRRGRERPLLPGTAVTVRTWTWHEEYELAAVWINGRWYTGRIEYGLVHPARLSPAATVEAAGLGEESLAY